MTRQRAMSMPRHNRRRWLIVMLVGLLPLWACGRSAPPAVVVEPTKTPLPTFTLTPSPTLIPTATPSLSPTPLPPTPTDPPPTAPATLPTDTPLPATPTSAPLPTETATPVPLPSTPTPLPTATLTPTVTPSPEPVINYVLASTAREFNCDTTAIYGSVRNANNFGIPGVTVRALGIHESSGLEFSSQTDAEGNYEIFRIPLNELPGAQWAVMVMEEGREASERFHWASTPVCESDDTGHSQVLRIDWKLIE